jgi:hypothetical protein
MTNRRIALVVILFLGLVGGVTSAWLRAPSSPRASLRAPVVAPGNPGVAPGEPLPTTVQVGDEGADAGRSSRCGW